jgi:hypothetical protein
MRYHDEYVVEKYLSECTVKNTIKGYHGLRCRLQGSIKYMSHLYGLIRHNNTLTILAKNEASSYLTDSTDREKTVL